MSIVERGPTSPAPASSQNLADVLERVLDKGVVIAGDIQVNLLSIELLTIKLRLLIASVDKANEIGIDWWRADPWLPSDARAHELEAENRSLRARLDELEEAIRQRGLGSGNQETSRGSQRRGE